MLEPNGLLAAGGDLSVERLVAAYELGIFPWYSEGDPILWWSPNPRNVLLPGTLRISRSLRKRVRKCEFEVSFDTAFDAVISACAAPRRDSEGTWISLEMQSAYAALHARGIAHSVECWQHGEIVGGLYGIAIGSVFFGESMFSRVSDASKVALVHLCAHPFSMIDCQLTNPHLSSLGAQSIARAQFEQLLRYGIQRSSVRLGDVCV
jgi:leucyl/phenylalanyl-tRNA---protein transferase